MSELDLLCECLSTEGEAEGGGVKFVWMDENTVYRFENNRMKKIGKQLLNKARKEITKRNKVQQLKEQAADDEDSEDEKPRKKSKKVKKQDREELEDDEMFPKPKKIRRNIESIDDDFDEAEDEREENERPSKRGKKQLTKTSKTSAALPSVDLDEYYDNKHRMEYMTLEITRLNNKIGKLKQYKSIVNKLTGGEIDDLPQSRQQQAPEADETAPPGKQKYNDNLFMF